MNRNELVEIMFILDDLITKLNKKIWKYRYEDHILMVWFDNNENSKCYVLGGGNNEKEN